MLNGPLMAHDCVHARVLGCDAASPRVRALMLTMTTILRAIPRNTVILEVTNQIREESTRTDSCDSGVTTEEPLDVRSGRERQGHGQSRARTPQVSLAVVVGSSEIWWVSFPATCVDPR